MTPIERANEIVQRELDTLINWREEYLTHQSHLVKMIELFGENDQTTFSMNLSYVCIRILEVNDIPLELKHIHPIMRKAGYVPRHFNKENAIWEWGLPNRTKDPVSSQFFFNLSENSVCRKVQVGTKETPVYEIQCGDSVGIEVPV
ncbi:hypothetical protein LCGC14_2106830 [marine sediment metagenome]|uniref:Uncharacterized protein n=1 Tax=marine sediment metagenome TaxID=412755 RepID=A0A0F9H4P2_9ZZZZ